MNDETASVFATEIKSLHNAFVLIRRKLYNYWLHRRR